MSDNDTSKIITQLRMLLQLTNTEAQIAQARQAQARTDAVRRELAENEKNSRTRALQIERVLRDVGGVPDVVSPLLGRLAAMVKTVVEQAEPLDGALLEDLSLEHQLFDRARYLKVLATSADMARVRTLAERLEVAHQATIDWLSTVLAEEALGGPTALRPTPLQAVAGTATRIVNSPARWSADGLNRAVATVKQTRSKAEDFADDVADRASDVADKAGDVTDAAREAVAAGRDASMRQAEKVARRDGNSNAAEAVHDSRKSSGQLSASELPIKGYDSMTITKAVAAIKKLSDPDDVRTIIAYEEAHKNRSGVVSASQTQLASIAKDVAGIG
ncbi:ferritin-like domain-containing protein [Rhodococcus sp. X156]|uniref:ferritin-like domain-containing protein n=1 Tax=Rhodococcus sp. X156 TaxID=2499145 RepID=UPI000FD8A70A|nr:ferritin-like domain-containing protein [Rhodococcus sp. X156]